MRLYYFQIEPLHALFVFHLPEFIVFTGRNYKQPKPEFIQWHKTPGWLLVIAAETPSVGHTFCEPLVIRSLFYTMIIVMKILTVDTFLKNQTDSMLQQSFHFRFSPYTNQKILHFYRLKYLLQ